MTCLSESCGKLKWICFYLLSQRQIVKMIIFLLCSSAFCSERWDAICYIKFWRLFMWRNLISGAVYSSHLFHDPFGYFHSWTRTSDIQIICSHALCFDLCGLEPFSFSRFQMLVRCLARHEMMKKLQPTDAQHTHTPKHFTSLVFEYN